MEYGKETDSRIIAVNQTHARAWALNQIKDTDDNYIRFTYTNDAVNGQFYPDSILYTYHDNANQSAQRFVVFEYEDRDDAVPNYLAGSIVEYTKRLKKVNTFLKNGRKPQNGSMPINCTTPIAQQRVEAWLIQFCCVIQADLACSRPNLTTQRVTWCWKISWGQRLPLAVLTV